MDQRKNLVQAVVAAKVAERVSFAKLQCFKRGRERCEEVLANKKKEVSKHEDNLADANEEVNEAEEKFQIATQNVMKTETELAYYDEVDKALEQVKKANDVLSAIRARGIRQPSPSGFDVFVSQFRVRLLTSTYLSKHSRNSRARRIRLAFGFYSPNII
jgi:predicted ribosome quality control (RQC) complex YloA/Tae2 family protein